MQMLIEKAVQGDVESFLELMNINSLAMYKVARAILSNDDDAADAIQNTILNCFQKLHTLKKPAATTRATPSWWTSATCGRPGRSSPLPRCRPAATTTSSWRTSRSNETGSSNCRI